jgi:hypothetical protein
MPLERPCRDLTKSTDEDQKPAIKQEAVVVNNKTVIMNGSVSTNQLNRDVGTGHYCQKNERQLRMNEELLQARSCGRGQAVMRGGDSASTNQPEQTLDRCAYCRNNERQDLQIQYHCSTRSRIMEMGILTSSAIDLLGNPFFYEDRDWGTATLFETWSSSLNTGTDYFIFQGRMRATIKFLGFFSELNQREQKTHIH